MRPYHAPLFKTEQRSRWDEGRQQDKCGPSLLVSITSDVEGRFLSDGTGARQQQIAEALKAGVESYFRNP